MPFDTPNCSTSSLDGAASPSESSPRDALPVLGCDEVRGFHRRCPSDQAQLVVRDSAHRPRHGSPAPKGPSMRRLLSGQRSRGQQSGTQTRHGTGVPDGSRPDDPHQHRRPHHRPADMFDRTCPPVADDAEVHLRQSRRRRPVVVPASRPARSGSARWRRGRTRSGASTRWVSQMRPGCCDLDLASATWTPTACCVDVLPDLRRVQRHEPGPLDRRPGPHQHRRRRVQRLAHRRARGRAPDASCPGHPPGVRLKAMVIEIDASRRRAATPSASRGALRRRTPDFGSGSTGTWCSAPAPRTTSRCACTSGDRSGSSSGHPR
jgi:hypothetical protein